MIAGRKYMLAAVCALAPSIAQARVAAFCYPIGANDSDDDVGYGATLNVDHVQGEERWAIDLFAYHGAEPHGGTLAGVFAATLTHIDAEPAGARLDAASGAVRLELYDAWDGGMYDARIEGEVDGAKFVNAMSCSVRVQVGPVPPRA